MGYPRTHWTPEMDTALRKYRAQGHCQRTCADLIGVWHGAVAKRCQELGVSQRMNRGTLSGVKLARTSKEG